MPVALNPTGLPEWVGLCAALFSVVQLVFAPRRDLGSVTLGIAGAALILSMPEGSTYVAVAVAIALFVAAAAWFRAGKHGVGRPALNGLAFAIVGVCALGPSTLPALVPALDPALLRDVLLMPCLFVALFCGVLALERPGPRRTRVHWIGRVPIEEPTPVKESASGAP